MYIPNQAAPDGAFTRAMDKLGALRVEVKENARTDADCVSWLESFIGRWRFGLVTIGVSILICVVIMGFMLC